MNNVWQALKHNWLKLTNSLIQLCKVNLNDKNNIDFLNLQGVRKILPDPFISTGFNSDHSIFQ